MKRSVLDQVAQDYHLDQPAVAARLDAASGEAVLVGLRDAKFGALN